MKAICFVGVNKDLEIHDVDLPILGDDDVLIKVAGCGVCHTDIGFWRQGVPTKKPLPLVLGHEVSGVVVDAGAQFRELIDLQVIVPAVIPCGQCPLCVAGRSNICPKQLMPGNDIDGGYAEFMAVPGRALCPVSEKGAYELPQLSVIADAVTTPYQAVVRSGLQSGDLAIVIGVGGIGGYGAQIAAAFGGKVIAIDVDNTKLETLAKHCPVVTINAAENDFRTLKGQVSQHASQWGCAKYGWKIFECSGTAAGQLTAFGLMNTASILMVIGFTLDKANLRLSNLMAKDATVQGTWGCQPELYPQALQMVTQEKIKLAPFIKTFAMSEGPQILSQVADHQIAERAILVPDW